MAQVTYGAYITELKGSIGGSTFQRNAARKICRARPLIFCPHSAWQLTRQRNMARLSFHWSTLSSANKQTWVDLALAHNHIDHWSIEKTITGFQWFMSCNMNLLLTGAFILDTAPAWRVLNPFPSYTLQTTVDYLRIFMSDIYTQTGYYLFAFCTPLIRESSVKIRKTYVSLGSQTIESDYYVYLSPGWCSRFGYTWSDIFNYAKGCITVHIGIYGSFDGFSNPFVSAQLKL